MIFNPSTLPRVKLKEDNICKRSVSCFFLNLNKEPATDSIQSKQSVITMILCQDFLDLT